MTKFEFDRDDPLPAGSKDRYDTVVATRVPRAIMEKVTAFQRQHGLRRSAALRELICKGVEA